jgi:hypothetical protein
MDQTRVPAIERLLSVGQRAVAELQGTSRQRLHFTMRDLQICFQTRHPDADERLWHF